MYGTLGKRHVLTIIAGLAVIVLAPFSVALYHDWVAGRKSEHDREMRHKDLRNRAYSLQLMMFELEGRLKQAHTDSEVQSAIDEFSRANPNPYGRSYVAATLADGLLISEKPKSEKETICVYYPDGHVGYWQSYSALVREILAKGMGVSARPAEAGRGDGDLPADGMPGEKKAETPSR